MIYTDKLMRYEGMNCTSLKLILVSNLNKNKITIMLIDYNRSDIITPIILCILPILIIVLKNHIYALHCIIKVNFSLLEL